MLTLACASVRERVRNGEDHAAERVLEAFPQLCADEEHVVEVIFTEFDESVLSGIDVSPESFKKRFPDRAERLERLFQISESIEPLKKDCDTEYGSNTLIEQRGGPSVSSTNAGALSGGFERYSIRKEIARGGMGIVYQAVDIRLNRIVAIKTMRNSWPNETERRRFLQEAAMAARLHHPNIVQVFEVNETRDGPFCVMEWVPGESLNGITKRNTFSANDAARIVRILASAVHYAHDNGIIHRDLKPANILMTENGEPKVADFGLAKFEVVPDNGENTGSTSAMSTAGSIVGTPSYMAPEQVMGKSKDVNARSDVYALGAILYEMLTGRPPFHGATTVETLGLVLSTEVVPPSRFNPRLPRDLENVCLKCLRKDPRERYASAAELQKDVERFQCGMPTLARPVPRMVRAAKWCRRNPTVATLLALLVLAVFGGVSGIVWNWQAARFNLQLATQRQSDLEQANRQAQLEKEQALFHQQKAEKNFAAAQAIVNRIANLGVQFTRDSTTEQAGRDLLAESIRFHADVLSLNRDDPDVRYATARAYLRVGRTLNELGRWDEAIESNSRAVELMKTLCEQDRSNSDVAFWLQEAFFQLAYAYRGNSDVEAAKDTFARGVEVGEENVKWYPDNERMKSHLSILLINWRTCVDRRSPEFGKALQRAVALQEEVIASNPSGIWPLQDLAQGKENLAVEHQKQGDLEAARQNYQEALRIRQRIQSRQPKDPMHPFYLARTHYHLGKLHFVSNDLDSAKNSYLRALTLTRELKKNHPYTILFHTHEIDVSQALVELLLKTSQFDEAFGYYRQILKSYQDAIFRWEDNERYPRQACRYIDSICRWTDAHADNETSRRFKEASRVSLGLMTTAYAKSRGQEASASPRTTASRAETLARLTKLRFHLHVAPIFEKSQQQTDR